MDLLTAMFGGWGAIAVGVVMALTVRLKWPSWLHYIWAALVIISGLLLL